MVCLPDDYLGHTSFVMGQTYFQMLKIMTPHLNLSSAYVVLSSDWFATAEFTSATVVRFLQFSLKFCNLYIYLFMGVKWMFTSVNSFSDNFLGQSELNSAPVHFFIFYFVSVSKIATSMSNFLKGKDMQKRTWRI